MILVIDNYDSFVYNLARYVENTGHPTLVIRNDKLTLIDIKKLDPTHIIISPGPGLPKDAGIILAIIKHFYTKLPILGVCLGHQAIGQAFGAKIVRAKYPMHGKASNISHNQLGIFANLPNPLQVGRYHSLIVDTLPKHSQLQVIAHSLEGEVMGLAHKNYPLIGLQFHPEAILTSCGMQLIENFVQLNYNHRL